MAQFTDLPDELIVQILAHNIPQTLRKPEDFPALITQYAASQRLLRLIRYIFFQNFTHSIDLSCIYTALSRHCAYTQVHTHGVLAIRKSFCAQVRHVHLRLRVYSPQSINVAVEEVRRALHRYVKLRRIRVSLLDVGKGEVLSVLLPRLRELVDKEEFRSIATGRVEEVKVEVVDALGNRITNDDVFPAVEAA